MKRGNDIELIELMVNVAKLRYEGEKLSQKNIATRLKIKQPEVSTLLKQAEKEGIIQINHKIIIPTEPKLERDLQTRYEHLSKVIVVNCRSEELLLEQLGQHAAREIISSLVSDTSICLSCGTTISATLEALKKYPINKKNIEVLPLLIVLGSRYESPSPAGLVAECTKIFPSSKGEVVQFPEPLPQDEAKKIKNFYEKQCKDILLRSLKAKYMIIGIGGIDKQKLNPEDETYSFNYLINKLGLRDKILELEGIGECVHQPLRIDGHFLMDNEELEILRNHLIYVNLEELAKLIKEQSAHILAIAGGKQKHEAILAATNAKIFDQLITDRDAAEYLLEH